MTFSLLVIVIVRNERKHLSIVTERGRRREGEGEEAGGEEKRRREGVAGVLGAGRMIEIGEKMNGDEERRVGGGRKERGEAVPAEAGGEEVSV